MQVALHVTPESPEIILALDRSTAMNASLGSTNQIAAAQDALAAVVAKYQRPIANFDYLEFPGQNFNCPQSSACPCASQVAPVDPRSFEFAMLHRCDTQGPGCPMSAERPTGSALSSSLEYYSQLNGGPKRYVVLVTDGAPTCSSGTGCPEAEIVNSLRRDGVDTAVVVVGSPPDDQCLSQIANTGGRGGMNPSFYFSATTPEGLNASLDAVVRAMAIDAACHLDLPGGPPDNPDQVTLLLGAVIPRGTPDGWQYDDNSHTQITLSAAACQTFLDNPGSLSLLGCASSRSH
jgi:hypothetical protein